MRFESELDGQDFFEFERALFILLGVVAQEEFRKVIGLLRQTELYELLQLVLKIYGFDYSVNSNQYLSSLFRVLCFRVGCSKTSFSFYMNPLLQPVLAVG